MIIEVLQDDIDIAGWGSYSCPIAKALNRKFNKSHGYACKAMIGFLDEDSKQYKPSTRAIRFMRAFDNGYNVKPAKFRLQEVIE